MYTDLGPGLLVLSGFSPGIGKRQTGDVPRDLVGGPVLVLPTGFTGGVLGPATGRAGEKALGPCLVVRYWQLHPPPMLPS